MRDVSFSGKTALVFGGAGGIGGATAEALRSRGADVWIADVRPPAAAVGGFLAVDVTKRAEVDAAVGRASEKGLDILVYAAGITRDSVLWKLTDDDWNVVMDVNLRGAFFALRAAAPKFRARGGGAAVFVTSINGERGKFGQANYAASKAGLIAFTKTAAKELGRFGVRVNAVAPGITDTEMTRALPPDVIAAAVEETALGRAAKPEDVADAILFLVSDLARHVTGQTLRVDGGQLM